MADQPQIKQKQINIRLTPTHELALKQHCIRENITTQKAVIAALKTLVPGFE